METPERAAVTVAREQLASELGCAPEALAVETAEAVEWSDSSLGCPKPGMMYMQVITPGYRVVLVHDGQRYTMHTGRGRAVRCGG